MASPLLEASIDGARGILLNITAATGLGLYEVNEAASVIQDVAHPDANIIFGTVIDDSLGEEIRVTVIAAGFDRWDDGAKSAATTFDSDPLLEEDDLITDIFSSDNDDDGDDIDVPSFLR